MRPPEAELPAGLFTGTVELLRELTAISSPSGDPAGQRRMAERLGAALRERGLAAEVREEPGEGGAPLPVLTFVAPQRKLLAAQGGVRHADIAVQLAGFDRDLDESAANRVRRSFNGQHLP